MKHHVPRMSLGSQGWEGRTEEKQAHQVSLLHSFLCVFYTGTLVSKGKRLKFIDTDYLA